MAKDEEIVEFARSPRLMSRRAALAPLAGLAALPLAGRRGRAESQDDPPAFSTQRRQFVISEPAMQLPAVMLTDREGRPARLAATPGKVLLINIWATWCPACRIDLPLLQRFHEAAGDRVKVAAVSTDTVDRQKIGAYLEKLGIRALPIYLDPQERLASSDRDRRVPLPLFGMPITYLVTPSGRIAGYVAGTADWLADDAQKLIAYYGDA